MGQTWQQLPAIDLVTVLTRLQAAGGEALVTLMQRSGAGVTGHLGQIDVKTARSVVVRDAEGDRVWFVGLHDITAVCVHGSTQWGPALSDGTIDPASLAEPIAPLAANRRLQEFAGRIGRELGREVTMTIEWDGFDRDHRDAMAGMGMFLVALETALDELVAEPFAKDAVAAKIQSIVIRSGPRDLQLVGGVLSLTIDPAAGADGRYDAYQLGQALNVIL